MELTFANGFATSDCMFQVMWQGGRVAEDMEMWAVGRSGVACSVISVAKAL